MEDVLSAYDQLQKPLQNDSQLLNFLSEYFTPAGSELIAVPSEDLTTNATFLEGMSNAINREFVQQIVDRWPELTRAYNTTTVCESCQSSFIPVQRPFVIAGGRFREPYYWDSYWIILGLLRSGGSFIEISRNQIENFLDNVEAFGFVPNGARRYYLNRSQPPVLAQMVRVYVEHTGDNSILERALPLMIREHDFFEQNRSASVTVGDQTYTLQRYAAFPYASPQRLTDMTQVQCRQQPATARILSRGLAAGQQCYVLCEKRRACSCENPVPRGEVFPIQKPRFWR